jgi:hypothetical protein
VCPKGFYEGAELGPFLPYTDYAVIRAAVNRPRSAAWAKTMLFDIQTDYHQTTDMAGTEIEKAYQELLAAVMKKMDAPAWQFKRMGLVAESE